MKKNPNKRTQKQRIGDRGENQAAAYLTAKGYTILDRNFSCKAGEIDIVAINPKSNIISFIEVKSRNSLSFGPPCQAVNSQKQKRIVLTSQYYLFMHPSLSSYQPSFDIIEILNLNFTYIRHLKNSF